MSSSEAEIHDIPTDLSCLPSQVHPENLEFDAACASEISNLDQCRTERQRARARVFKNDVRGVNNITSRYSQMIEVTSPRFKGTGSSKLGSYEKQWMDRYMALKEYKEKFGDCIVSQKGPYPVLGRWVNKQRDFYKLYRAGKRTTLNETRIQLLEDIEFVWDASAIKRSYFKRDDEKWMKYYNQLQIYYEKNGNCMVRRKYKVENLPLGEWVHKQRQQYTLKKRGKYSTISEERIEKLNELNFNWPHIVPSHTKGSSLNDEKVETNTRSGINDHSLLHHPEIAIDSETSTNTVTNDTQVHDHRHHPFNVDVEHYLRSIMPVSGEENDNQVVVSIQDV